MEQRLASICRASYQRFAASPTVTPFETILPIAEVDPELGLSVGENESRNIKGAHFAVGCGYSYHQLLKGAPL
jgi:hypothetical protein